MFHIVSAWGAQTNPHYDPDTANNGGGYWQFSGGIVVDLNGQLVTVEVDDTSCGDFGSRVYFSVTADGFCWQFFDGTMDDASIDTPEENMSVISCKLKREVAETFKATAKANGTTPNELIRKWIDAYVRQNMPAEQPSAEKI